LSADIQLRKMSRTAIIPLLLTLATGLVLAQDERPRMYEGSPIVEVDDRLTKQGVSYRLPNDTFPHRYDIELSTRIDLGQFDFTGKVTILLEAKSVTSMITVHSKQLTIPVGAVSLRNAATQQQILTTHVLDEPLEFLKISTTSPLVIGQRYTLEISYSGTMRIDNGGFYRSSYVNEAGATKWLGTTQFERTEARHAFPSYDEPGIRATYGLRITHGRSYHAVSNMPMKEQLK
jgi:aminopeptidase N